MFWKVQHLCDKQLKDINKEDIIYHNNIPMFRKCNTYKGGGGYDQFPAIYANRFPNESSDNLNQQFVVQLHGCPLDCPYCYVTREGIQSDKFSLMTTDELLQVFVDSNCRVFHLMGGAPGLYIDNWIEIIDGLSNINRSLNKDFVFHSDLLLIESLYNPATIVNLANRKNCLYAISIKGSTAEEFLANTNTYWNQDIFWANLQTIIELRLPVYLTFTNMSKQSIDNFKQQVRHRFSNEIDKLFDDSFAIDLINYEALK